VHAGNALALLHANGEIYPVEEGADAAEYTIFTMSATGALHMLPVTLFMTHQKEQLEELLLLQQMLRLY